jgi:DNA primase
MSVPLSWEELDSRIASDHFTVLSVPARLSRRRGDPESDYWRARQRISKHAFNAVVGRSR